jgi:hypothetical protein
METYTPENAPGFAKARSTFTNDERCYDAHYVVGSDYDEVRIWTVSIFDQGGYSDYDINWSTEGEQFVGVVCKDVV